MARGEDRSFLKALGPGLLWVAVLLLLLCGALLLAGHYRWLDAINKVIVLVLTLTTFTATALVIPKIPWATIPWLPDASAYTDVGTVLLALCFGLLGAGPLRSSAWQPGR